MGASCCGLARGGFTGGFTGGSRRVRSRYKSTRLVHSAGASHSAVEPLLRENEREAVSNLLRYLEEGSSSSSGSGGHGMISDDHLLNLCTLAYSDNMDLQRSAALCFSEFSEKLTAPVSVALLEPLIHLLISSDVEVQKASSHALSNLALRGAEENKLVIISAGALRPLIAMLSLDNPDVQCNACGCITTLATMEANKLQVVREGAIRPLLALSRSPNPKVQRNAAGALLNLTHIESNRHLLVEAGAIQVFVQLLDSCDQDIQFYCAAALSNLAVHALYRKAIVSTNEAKAIPSLIRLMKSTKDKVCCQACLAIRNLGSDDSNQELIVSLGGLAALVPLLQTPDTETVMAAMAALRNLSIHKGNEIKIVKSGVLEDLKRLVVVRESPNIQCHAAGTIRNLAAENQTEAILKSGCVEALGTPLQEMHTTSEAVLGELCAAMAVLAAEECARSRIMALQNGTFHKTLLNLLDLPFPEVNYNSAGVIGHLAFNDKYHNCFLEGKVSIIKYLIRFMHSTDENFVHIALWITAQFSSGDNSTKVKLSHSSLVDKLKQIRASKVSEEMLDLANSTLSNLAIRDDVTKK